MKRLTALLLTGIFSLGLLAGCNDTTTPAENDAPLDAAQTSETAPAKTGEPTESTATAGGVFNNYFTGDIDTINPHIYTLSNSADVFALVSMRLYFQLPTADGENFVLTGELAESDPVQMDDEGKVWHIKIRENALWENGDAINIDDVLYSFQMCLDPILVNSRASQLASDYITIENAEEYYLQGSAGTVDWEDVGINRVDDYTLEFVLTDPVTGEDVKNHLNYVWCSIVHKPTYESGMDADRSKTSYGSNADNFMSCGPFVLKDWINGSLVTMDRNPDYVFADTVKLDGYTFKMLGDANTALELFLAGELDVVNLVAEVVEQYMDDPRVMPADALSIQTLTINHGNTENNGILGNLNFRKALFYAVDRQAIARLTNGVPANYLVPQKCLGDTEAGHTFRQMPAAQAYLEDNLGYDPERAKEYYDLALQECGLDSLTLTLQYNETSNNNRAASEYLQKEIPNIFGDTFTLNLMAGSSSVLNTYISGWKEGDPNSYELQWRGWNTSTIAPWNGLKVYSSMYSNKNEPYYNEEFDDLWTKANYDLEAKLDPAYRLELTMEMERVGLEDVCTVPVYEAPRYFLISERVQLPAKFYIPAYGFGYYLSTIVE